MSHEKGQTVKLNTARGASDSDVDLSHFFNAITTNYELGTLIKEFKIKTQQTNKKTDKHF